MGYTKIVQYGNITEVYNYQKNVNKGRRVHRRSPRSKASTGNYRKSSSLVRAKTNFYRLVVANLHTKKTPLFITTTFYKEVTLDYGYKANSIFIQNCRRYFGKDITFITVPEWQPKSDRLHFHSLAWGLNGITKEGERNNRFLQRCWGRGYLDVLVAKDSSEKIAGYLTKYMSKANSDKRLNGRRAYTSTYNISRAHTAGGNSLNHYSDLLINELDQIQKFEYDTKYLGKCTKITYNKSENATNNS